VCANYTGPRETNLNGKPKYRFYVDFRALNAVTKFDRYPLTTLAGSQYFSV
jgi:hypothetical protein